MEFVEPIRDVKKIAQIKNLLRGKGEIRDLLLFELGINSALRISDLLPLKVSDLFESDLSVRDFFNVREEKTNKSHQVTITPKVKDTLALYRETYPNIIESPDNYVFFKKKTYPLGSAPIGRKMSWLFLSKICEEVGLKGNYGNHSLRKTWGYQARLNAIPMEVIQQKLNHSSLAVTRRYLGITADEIREACEKLDL